MASGQYRTDDLALAVALALEQFEYRVAKLTERKVVWDFTFDEESRGEDFDNIVHAFWEFEHKVEPRAFTLRWAEMRRELFSHIPPHHRPVHPAAAAQ